MKPGSDPTLTDAFAPAGDARAQVPAASLWAAADWMKLAILTVTANARVTGTNVAARGLLQTRSPLRVTTEGLVATVGSETRRLREVIAAPPAQPESVLLSPAGEGPLVPAVIAPAGPGVSVMFIADGAHASPIAAAALTRLYGLTRAEAHFAIALARGVSIENAAAALAIARSTARTHLKRIFLKTETNRQAQLVSLILSLPHAHLVGE